MSDRSQAYITVSSVYLPHNVSHTATNKPLSWVELPSGLRHPADLQGKANLTPLTHPRQHQHLTDLIKGRSKY